MSIADKLITVADNVSKVYEQGIKSGETKGYNTGYEVGREYETNYFWDRFQDYGRRTRYKGAFMYFTKAIFKPKYNIVFPGTNSPLEAQNMFHGCQIPGSYTQLLKDLGITIDFSKCTNVQEVFSSSSFSEITLYAPLAKSGYGLCAYAQNLVDLNLTLSDDFSWQDAFLWADNLTNLTLGMKITKNGFSVSTNKKLNKSSIENIINALSSTTSKLTVTLSKTAVNNAFGINIDDPTTWAEGTEYYELRHSRDNWTITYV